MWIGSSATAWWVKFVREFSKRISNPFVWRAERSPEALQISVDHVDEAQAELQDPAAWFEDFEDERVVADVVGPCVCELVVPGGEGPPVDDAVAVQ